jgi:hypothetical protein
MGLVDAFKRYDWARWIAAVAFGAARNANTPENDT